MKELLAGTHFMVDLETTGLDVEAHAIREIGCVKFSFRKEVPWAEFQISVKMHPQRTWDENTLLWQVHPDRVEALRILLSDGVPPRNALEDFESFVNDSEPNRENRWFWSKPTTFDYSFLQSYWKMCGMATPFFYRNIMDLNSFLRGQLYEPTGTLSEEVHLKYPRKHTAIQDCKDQIEVLMNTIRFLHAT